MADTGAGDVDDRLAELLADVADDYRARRGRGEDPDPEEYAARHPAAAGAIRRVLGRPRAAAPAPPAGPAPAGPVSGVLGDFRLLREVGRGGMGVVYEAEQVSLGRRVAVKVLPFAAVADPRSLERFRHEARAAAALDHPHVVKVYGVGCDRGVHHIALQFVDGRSLADLIAALRPAAGAAVPPRPAAPADPTRSYDPAPGTGPAGAAPAAARETTRAGRGTTAGGPPGRDHHRRAAGWVADAADALEHAHALGVVHRDVKPGNLLVDARGHVYVADFGLAQVAAADAGLTHTGDLLGTPRYMSPEQAAARHNLVDHRTDVYALGATLYELLTLEPAVPGKGRPEVLRNIAEADPVPPRKHDRRVPRDLETIALKCLEKDPARRYQTAKELADDLRRWLDDKPIAAKPPTRRDRAARWVRRNRGLVAAGVALLAVAAVVAAAGAALVWREKEAKAQALADRTEALAAAERRLGLTRRAADEMYTQVAEEWLAQQPRLQPKQREFLEKARALYEELARESGDDPAARLDAARAALKLGRIEERLGRTEQAAAAYQAAIRDLESVAADTPQAETLSDLANTYCGLGVFHNRLRRTAEAEAALRTAGRYATELQDRFPGDPAGPRQLATIANLLGVMAWGAGRPDEAVANCREAIRLYDLFVGPGSPPRDRWSQIAPLTNLAQFLSNSARDREEAIGLARRAGRVADGLAAEYPSHADYEAKRAEVRMFLGTVLIQAGAASEAVPPLTDAVRAFERLADRYPDVPDYRDSLGGSYQSLSNALLRTGGRTPDGLDAAGAGRRGVAIFEKLAADFPTDGEFRERYTGGLAQWTHVLEKSGTPLADRLPALRRLLDARLRLVADFPDVARYRTEAAKTAYVLAYLLVPAVAKDPAARDEALKAIRVAVDLAPRNGVFRWQWADIHTKAGQWAEAAAVLEEYFRTGGTGLDEEFMLSLCYSRLGEREKARQTFDRATARRAAIARARGIVLTDAGVPGYRPEAARALAREAAPPPRPARPARR